MKLVAGLAAGEVQDLGGDLFLATLFEMLKDAFDLTLEAVETHRILTIDGGLVIVNHLVCLGIDNHDIHVGGVFVRDAIDAYHT
jgi:hypothetical protein